VVVTMILVPATMRWHWWRFSARAFVWSMASSVAVIILQKIFFGYWSPALTLAFDTLASLFLTVIIGFISKPTEMEVLVRFYSRVRPFGFWKPVRLEAQKRGLVPHKDRMPAFDALNGFLTMGFQLALALVPFYFLLRFWKKAMTWGMIALVLSVILYFSWYKNLPSKKEV